MGRESMFLTRTPEGLDAGSPWTALSEIELDLHSSKRSEPDLFTVLQLTFFLTFKNILQIVPYQTILVPIIILYTAAEYLISFSQSHGDEYLGCFQMSTRFERERDRGRGITLTFLYIHYPTYVPSIS